MTKKELYKQLRMYDRDTQIKIGYFVNEKAEMVYKEIPLELQNIMVSHLDGKDTIIFYPITIRDNQ